MTHETNVSVVMMTLNESEYVEECLDSAEVMFDELVLIDGGSDDGTVSIAREWCADHGKRFELLQSSERELLLEGWGCQRRRGEELATCDYTLALDADEVVEVRNPEWFTREFEHNGYIHTRHRTSGQVRSDYRFYRPDPPMDLSDDDIPRWRGMIYEQIMTRDGTHIGRFYELAEAPFKVIRRRNAVSETASVHGRQQHTHAYEFGGYSSESMKKQHYLLEASRWSPMDRYLSPGVLAYYNHNAGIIKEHYIEIRDKFDLPEVGYGYVDEDHREKNHDKYLHYDLGDEVIMGHEQQTWTDYFKSQAKKQVSKFV